MSLTPSFFCISAQVTRYLPAVKIQKICRLENFRPNHFPPHSILLKKNDEVKWLPGYLFVVFFFAGALPGSPTTGPTSGEPVFLSFIKD